MSSTWYTPDLTQSPLTLKRTPRLRGLHPGTLEMGVSVRRQHVTKLFPVGVRRTSMADSCFANSTKTWKSPGMGSGLKSPFGNTRHNKKHPAGKPEHRQ